LVVRAALEARVATDSEAWAAMGFSTTRADPEGKELAVSADEVAQAASARVAA